MFQVLGSTSNCGSNLIDSSALFKFLPEYTGKKHRKKRLLKKQLNINRQYFKDLIYLFFAKVRKFLRKLSILPKIWE